MENVNIPHWKIDVVNFYFSGKKKSRGEKDSESSDLTKLKGNERPNSVTGDVVPDILTDPNALTGNNMKDLETSKSLSPTLKTVETSLDISHNSDKISESIIGKCEPSPSLTPTCQDANPHLSGCQPPPVRMPTPTCQDANGDSETTAMKEGQTPPDTTPTAVAVDSLYSNRSPLQDPPFETPIGPQPESRPVPAYDSSLITGFEVGDESPDEWLDEQNNRFPVSQNPFKRFISDGGDSAMECSNNSVNSTDSSCDEDVNEVLELEAAIQLQLLRDFSGIPAIDPNPDETGDYEATDESQDFSILNDDIPSLDSSWGSQEVLTSHLDPFRLNQEPPASPLASTGLYQEPPASPLDAPGLYQENVSYSPESADLVTATFPLNPSAPDFIPMTISKPDVNCNTDVIQANKDDAMSAVERAYSPSTGLYLVTVRMNERGLDISDRRYRSDVLSWLSREVGSVVLINSVEGNKLLHVGVQVAEDVEDLEERVKTVEKALQTYQIRLGDNDRDVFFFLKFFRFIPKVDSSGMFRIFLNFIPRGGSESFKEEQIEATDRFLKRIIKMYRVTETKSNCPGEILLLFSNLLEFLVAQLELEQLDCFLVDAHLIWTDSKTRCQLLTEEQDTLLNCKLEESLYRERVYHYLVVYQLQIIFESGVRNLPAGNRIRGLLDRTLENQNCVLLQKSEGVFGGGLTCMLSIHPDFPQPSDTQHFRFYRIPQISVP